MKAMPSVLLSAVKPTRPLWAGLNRSFQDFGRSLIFFGLKPMPITCSEIFGPHGSWNAGTRSL